MATPEATTNTPEGTEPKRSLPKRNCPLLAQKFSVASQALRNSQGRRKVGELNTIDFYVDGKATDARTVGSMSLEEPEGRFFNAQGNPVILAPGEQQTYLDEQRRRAVNPNGNFELLESIEEQHGGPLRFEPWYKNLFREDQLRTTLVPGFIDINEQLKSVYSRRIMEKTPSCCQDYYDQKHQISIVDPADNAATQ